MQVTAGDMASTSKQKKQKVVVTKEKSKTPATCNNSIQILRVSTFYNTNEKNSLF